MGSSVSKLCKDFKLKSTCISNCCSNGSKNNVNIDDGSPKHHKHHKHHKHKKYKVDEIIQTDIDKKDKDDDNDIVG